MTSADNAVIGMLLQNLMAGQYASDADLLSALSGLNSGIGQLDSSLGGKLDSINSGIAGLGGIGTAIESMEGVVGEKLDTLHDDSENLGNKIVDGSEEVPEYEDQGTIEDNSDMPDAGVDGVEADSRYTAERDSYTTFLDTYMDSNPVGAVINGSHIEYDGGQSSVSVAAGPFSFDLNFSGCESALNTIGTFFVAFCGLAGVVDFLRG